jgi:hypothetical protein
MKGISLAVVMYLWNNKCWVPKQIYQSNVFVANWLVNVQTHF